MKVAKGRIEVADRTHHNPREVGIAAHIALATSAVLVVAQEELSWIQGQIFERALNRELIDLYVIHMKKLCNMIIDIGF